jgi:hypothetical protein
MEVLIENYRGVDVIFNTESQRFSFSFDEGKSHEKQSYSACKANIDKYLKDNQCFESITLRSDRDWNCTFKIVGIRKDNRFVMEYNGVRSQYSDYNNPERLYLKSDDDIHKRADEISSEISALMDERKAILETLTAPLFNKEYRREIRAKYGNK